jgi:hypothetical protein
VYCTVDLAIEAARGALVQAPLSKSNEAYCPWIEKNGGTDFHCDPTWQPPAGSPFTRDFCWQLRLGWPSCKAPPNLLATLEQAVRSVQRATWRQA